MNVNKVSGYVSLVGSIATIGILDNPIKVDINALAIATSVTIISTIVFLKTYQDIDVEIIENYEQASYRVRGGHYCDNPYYK